MHSRTGTRRTSLTLYTLRIHQRPTAIAGFANPLNEAIEESVKVNLRHIAGAEENMSTRDDFSLVLLRYMVKDRGPSAKRREFRQQVNETSAKLLANALQQSK